MTGNYKDYLQRDNTLRRAPPVSVCSLNRLILCSFGFIASQGRVHPFAVSAECPIVSGNPKSQRFIMESCHFKKATVDEVDALRYEAMNMYAQCSAVDVSTLSVGPGREMERGSGEC